ncbi:hypothetical protein LR48_Vigan01g024000 [Vigna angularis]|uniref:Uncharacterized protein n=1 Tax=Phaseolus angularis TaxID=3914 RepID=A0A0L9TJN6_PHAAN|nr:hypothetical protein LR48_Vigan01g024000 [Vigna angularis]
MLSVRPRPPGHPTSTSTSRPSDLNPSPFDLHYSAIQSHKNSTIRPHRYSANRPQLLGRPWPHMYLTKIWHQTFGPSASTARPSMVSQVLSQNLASTIRPFSLSCSVVHDLTSTYPKFGINHSALRPQPFDRPWPHRYLAKIWHQTFGHSASTARSSMSSQVLSQNLASTIQSSMASQILSQNLASNIRPFGLNCSVIHDLTGASSLVNRQLNRPVNGEFIKNHNHPEPKERVL